MFSTSAITVSAKGKKTIGTDNSAGRKIYTSSFCCCTLLYPCSDYEDIFRKAFEIMRAGDRKETFKIQANVWNCCGLPFVFNILRRFVLLSFKGLISVGVFLRLSTDWRKPFPNWSPKLTKKRSSAEILEHSSPCSFDASSIDHRNRCIKSFNW